MIIECVGLPGAGKTTICNAVSVLHGKKGDVPLYALRPSPSFLRAAGQIMLLCATARPFSFDRMKRGFNLVVFLRHYERRDLTILLDQGIVQKLWSILLDTRHYSQIRLDEVMNTLKPFAPDRLVWIKTPIDKALTRVASRNHGTSRLDRRTDQWTESRLARMARLLEKLIAQYQLRTDTRLHELDGLASAAENTKKLEELFSQSEMHDSMSDPVPGRLLRRSRRYRRQFYELALAACPEARRRSWFDRHIRGALSNLQKPAVPFVLADSAVGGELIFEVNPQTINFTVNKFQSSDYLMADWFVFPGNWSKTPVEENATYRCMRELAAAGENFKQTTSYCETVKRLQNSGPYMHNGRYIEQASDIDRYYENYSRIAAGMRSAGFQPEPADGADDPYVGVAIGPDGEVFHFRKGHHRFALARELGITSIPIKVHVIHTVWLERNLPDGTPPQRALVEQLHRHFEKVQNAG